MNLSIFKLNLIVVKIKGNQIAKNCINEWIFKILRKPNLYKNVMQSIFKIKFWIKNEKKILAFLFKLQNSNCIFLEKVWKILKYFF